MITNTEDFYLNTELTPIAPSQSPLTIHALTLTLTKQDETPIELCLTFQVTLDIYQRIDTESLFNLKPELRGSLTASEFTSESNIEITACLKPDLLTYIADIPTNLKNLSEQQPDHPFLSTENWLALQVKQHETGYRTFWDYLGPEAMTADTIDSEKVNDAIINFFTDCAEVNLQSMSSDAVSQALLEVTKEFEEWADTSLSDIDEESIAAVIESMGKAFEELAVSNSSDIGQNILPAIINFFTSDNWPFVKIQDQPVVRAIFAGKNGRLTCYAKARPDRAQFVFYSICPVSVPESKRLALAEFIARANYGTIIGNFELDFLTGEVRYKTSVELSGPTLVATQIKQLVYANVMMMDEYLPGIISVIDRNVEPKDAIAFIESPPTNLSEDASTDSEFPPTTRSGDTLTDSQSLLANPPSDDARSQPAEIQNSPASASIFSDVPQQKPDNNSLSPLQPPQLPVNSIAELPTNSVLEKTKHIGEILSLLTKEEIADFDRVRQMLREKQPVVAQTLSNRLKKQLAARLEDGSTVFADSKHFFEQNKTPVKTANLLRRYWNLFAQCSQLIEQGKNNSSSIEQTTAAILLVVRELADSIETRMTQLIASYTDAKLEIECLIEIAQLTEQLTYCREKLKNRA